jgi:hypothetical protein
MKISQMGADGKIGKKIPPIEIPQIVSGTFFPLHFHSVS